MTPEELKKIEDLIKAGEKAPEGCGEGNWYITHHPDCNGNAFIVDGLEHGMFGIEAEWHQANFIVAAANARAEIKSMLEENKRLRAALEEIDNYEIDWGTGLDENVSRIAQTAREALESEEENIKRVHKKIMDHNFDASQYKKVGE